MNSDNISSDLSKANSKNKRFQHRRSQTQSCLTSEAELYDTVDVNIDHMNFMRTNRPNNNPTNQTSRFSGFNNPIKNINIRHLSGVVGGVVKSKNPMVRIQNACFNLIIDQDASDLSKIRKMSMGYQQKGQHSRSASTVLKIRKQSQSKQESLRKKNTSFIAKSKQSLKQRQRQRQKQRQKVEKQDDKKICVIKDLTNKLQFTDFDIESWKLQIRKICKLMQELRNFGIADKKINNWCKNYFQSKKRGLIQIFMKKTMKKRSLNNEITYHIIQTQSSLLMRIAQFACPMTEKQRYFLGVEITLYRNFLEQKIANKHKLQLNQIEDRVKSNVEQAQTKQLARQLYQVENANIQVLTFFSDLQRLDFIKKSAKIREYQQERSEYQENYI